MTLKIKKSIKFKKDYKRISKDNSIKNELIEILTVLMNEKKLSQKFLDHSLKGKYKNCRECHIRADLLLVYSIEEDKLLLHLLRLGSHSEIF